MKLLITLLVVAGLGGGGYYYFKNGPGKNGALQSPTRPTTALVEQRDIRFEISAAGDIGPADQVSVRPEINGRIEELPVDFGDKVKNGALLCRLDDRDLQIERTQRLMEIDGAKLQLEKSVRNLKRQRELFDGRFISQEVSDDARTDHDLATNTLVRAEQALRLVDDRLRKTRIVAPFDCTVLTRPVSLGQTVSGSAGFNSGTEIMTIANLGEMIVSAHVNQADVVRLQEGRTVEIRAESVPGVKMTGLVERIAPQAVIKNGIKGFSARITIKDIDPRVRPGMPAVLSIPVSSADNVLSVPLAAVFTEGGERFVFVKTNDSYERRPITIGASDYFNAEVLDGLKVGEVVALDKTITGAAPGQTGMPATPGAGSTGPRRPREGRMSGEPGSRGGGGGNGRSREGSPGAPPRSSRPTGS
jgi:macrolide-specific efflux system membrane fusion protein